MRRSLAALGMTLGLLLGMTPLLALAHPLAPALLQLDETAPGQFGVLWRTPVTQLQGRAVTPRLPPECVALGAPQARIESGEALVSRWDVRCDGGLAERVLAVDGIEGSGINVVVRVAFAGGAEFKGLLGADQPELRVSTAQPPVFTRYLELGTGHLLTGPDHLLFLLGLFLLVPTLRSLVATVTAFTLGHSLTLALAALDVLHVRQAWAELAIALTVLLLALEIVKPATGQASLMRRRPWLMAGAFGLIHGLGFAGALRDIGLPPADIPLSLLGFNLGIEAAQLGLVALLLAAATALRRMPLAWRGPGFARAVPAYVTGSMAACWCLERSLALLG